MFVHATSPTDLEHHRTKSHADVPLAGPGTGENRPEIVVGPTMGGPFERARSPQRIPPVNLSGGVSVIGGRRHTCEVAKRLR